jgi:hypothetical protein
MGSERSSFIMVLRRDQGGPLKSWRSENSVYVKEGRLCEGSWERSWMSGDALKVTRDQEGKVRLHQLGETREVRYVT